jgi:hypothetical protein
LIPVSGDIAASDDHTHALGPERNFNESAYFNSLFVSVPPAPKSDRKSTVAQSLSREPGL